MHIGVDTIVSNLVGGLITIAVSWLSYYKSGRDLADKAEELKRHSIVILRALQNAGLADVVWGPDGSAVNVNYKVPLPTANVNVAAIALGGEQQSQPAPPPVYDRQHENPSEPT